MPDDLAAAALDAVCSRLKFAHPCVRGASVGESQPIALKVDGAKATNDEVLFPPARARWGRVDGIAFSEDGKEPSTRIYPVEPKEGSDGIVQEYDRFRLPRGAVVVRFEEG